MTLAPVLARPPEVHIADEPTLGLAPMVIETVLEMVVALRDAGTALLLVEEKSKHVLPIADSVVFLELGRIRWTGVKEEVDERALAQAYMGAEAR